MTDENEIIPISEEFKSLLIEEEMKDSYLTYAMTVLVDRALPDIRDGLKPVHRRILFSMKDLGLSPGSKYQKSAKIVGQCIGNYHPHGDGAIYDAMVRMAQDFSLRYELVDGQGNYGSIEGDLAAAYRYTEARMTKMASEMLDDIQYDTVDMKKNFDESRSEPVVLPSRVPNLLINGSAGIAVGMATNIPPHNLTEVCNAAVHMIDNPACTVSDLMEFIKAPDFPTGGYICGNAGAKRAYETGKGQVVMRAKVHTEQIRSKEALVVTEIPYAIKLGTLLESIIKADKDERVKGLSNMYGGSSREGIRLVLELKKGEDPDLVLNQLWKHTYLQYSFNMNMTALDKGRPKSVNLKRMLQAWIEHRIEVIVRRTRFLLAKDEARLHIVEGLLRAIDIIDEIIALIRSSSTPEEAKQGLIDTWEFSDIQAQAIIDMRLRRLTGLEKDKLQEENDELVARIAEYLKILGSKDIQFGMIKDDLAGIIEKHGDSRRSELIGSVTGLNMEDLIEDEECVVTVTNSGYIKRLPTDEYKTQRRGGKGVKGGKLKNEDDFISNIYLATTHQYMLIFTSFGKLHWLKVYEIPQASKISRGTHLANILHLAEGENINTVIPVREFDDDHYLLLATEKGKIKKTVLSAYGNPRKGGLIAINLREEDSLIGATVTDGNNEIMLASDDGQACFFNETDCRPMGRSAAGVTGIRLNEGAKVVSLLKREEGTKVLTICENGYGKRTEVDEYRKTKRGGKGVANIKTSERNGKVIASIMVQEDEGLMLISRSGMVVKTRVSDISVISRATQGVTIVRLKEGDALMSAANCVSDEEETSEETAVSEEENTSSEE